MRVFAPIPTIPLADTGMAGAIGWSLVLIVLIIIAFFAVVRLRAWLKDDDDAPVSVGFSLTDLRHLHRQGKMTDEEFEKARNLMVASTKRMAENIPDPLAGSKLAAERDRAARGVGSANPATPATPVPPRERPPRTPRPGDQTGGQPGNGPGATGR
jgi:hypothetical protein